MIWFIFICLIIAGIVWLLWLVNELFVVVVEWQERRAARRKVLDRPRVSRPIGDWHNEATEFNDEDK